MLSQCFDKGIVQQTGDKHFFIMSATEIAPTTNPQTPRTDCSIQCEEGCLIYFKSNMN